MWCCLCCVLQFWLLQFICVHDKNGKTHVARAGAEQLAGADTAPKRSVIIGGLRWSYIAPAECFYGEQTRATACAMSRFSTVAYSQTIRGREVAF